MPTVSAQFPPEKIRNVAIIAHVDHGKTTLVDALLKQAHVFTDHSAENSQIRIMDSNDIEAERGVTILAKNTAVIWNGYKINIIDTPGHADFSGEVERVLNMADGCVLLVDASEGVLSQTKFVLNLALKLGLKPIVVINKIDRKDERLEEVVNEVSDLFLELARDESQLDFPILYANGRQGIAGYEVKKSDGGDGSLVVADSNDITPLFEAMIKNIPAPQGNIDGDFQMQITNIDHDDYKGSYAIGRIRRGKVRSGDRVAILDVDGGSREAKVEYLFNFVGLKMNELDEAGVGEIVAIAGLGSVSIGQTVTDLENQEALPPLAISEPTVQVQFSVSTSPFVGREGEFTTSRQIGHRLQKELEKNVGLRVGSGPTAESFLVSGRGELHLAILIENMRREGFELSVGRPEVIIKEIDGLKQEPWESLTIEVPEEMMGIVTSQMGERKAIFIGMKQIKTGVKCDYEISTRNLIGFRSEFQTLTSGMGIVNSLFLGYRPLGEAMTRTRNGALVSAATGSALSYDLARIQERGTTFVEPGEPIYTGMIIGEGQKPGDIVMNACKGRKLTNVRSNADVLIRLTPAKKMSLEQCLAFLAEDELLEVTPKNLRLRKKELKVGNYAG